VLSLRTWASKARFEGSSRRKRPGAGSTNFFNQWLGLDALDGDQKAIPEYAGARQDMKTETHLFAEALFFEAQPWSNLFARDPHLPEREPGVFSTACRA